MIRSFITLGLQALLVAVIAVAPVAAQQDGPKGDDKAPDKSDEILKRLDKMQKDLTDDIAKMKKSIDDETDLKIKALQLQISKLASDLEAMKKSPRTSFDGPPAAGKGRVRLINVYRYGEVVIVVNGRSYRLKPFEAVYTDDLPAGTFTYEVLGIQGLLTKPLSPNEVFTITVQ